MAVTFLQFNTEKSVLPRWWWTNGDVSTAYGTEAGRSQVWLWWLMENMVQWSSSLQSVKPFIRFPFRPYFNEATQGYVNSTVFGFMTRASGAENGPVVDCGSGFTATGWALYTGNMDIYATIKNCQVGTPWDELPESAEYPGFVEVRSGGWSSYNVNAGPAARTLHTDDSEDVFNSIPGLSGGTGFPPTIMYSLDPGREFFVWIIQSNSNYVNANSCLGGIARMQGVPDKYANDGCANTGWFSVCAKDFLQHFLPQSSSEEAMRETNGVGEIYLAKGPFHTITSASGSHISSLAEDLYYSGDVGLNSQAYNRLWSKQIFSSATGIPVGHTGDHFIAGFPNPEGSSGNARGRILAEQREYKGNIYLCIAPALYWRIS